MQTTIEQTLYYLLLKAFPTDIGNLRYANNFLTQNQASIFSKNSFNSTSNNYKKKLQNYIYQNTSVKQDIVSWPSPLNHSITRLHGYTDACVLSTHNETRVCTHGLRTSTLATGGHSLPHRDVSQFTGITAPGLLVIVVSIHHPRSVLQV